MADAGPTQGAERRSQATGRWESHPWSARILRALIVIAPIAVTTIFTWTAARVAPPERLGMNRWIWVVGIFVIANLLLLGLRRVVHELTPLVGLMKLTLVFPDQAPSRAKATLRKGSSRSLLRQMEEARANGETSGEALHGEYLVQLLAEVNDHDRLTRGHSERVRAYAEMIGEELGLSEDDMNKLRWSALLHDVGKLTVPYEVLNKDGRPTDEEWEVLSGHPSEGGRMLEPLRGWLGDWVHSADQHHCRWDGGGYPSDLAGEDIALSGRIVAVADAYDVMTSARSYKKPLSAEVARRELTACAGSQFDPAMVRAFLNISLGRLRTVAGPFGWLINFLASAQVKIPIATTVTSSLTSTAALVAVTAAGAFPEPIPETLAMREVIIPVQTEDVEAEGLEDQPISIELQVAGGSGAISFRFVSPEHGQITLDEQQDGRDADDLWRQTITYRPERDFYGTDSFLFEACDVEERCQQAEVRVSVQSVNDGPDAFDDQSATAFGQSILIDALSNDTDREGDLLTIVSVEQPSIGEAILTEGKILYVPEDGFSGRVEIIYTMSDASGASSQAIIVIEVLAELIITPEPEPTPPTTVPDPPPPPPDPPPPPPNRQPTAADDVAATDEDTSIAIDVLANDSDPDDDVISVTALGAASHGQVTIENGLVRYEPDSNYHGSDSFTYVISDGTNSPVTAETTVTVRSINDLPVVTGPSSATVDEVAGIGLAVGSLSFSDSDNDTLTVSLTAGDPGDRFSIDAAGAITVHGALDHETTPSYSLEFEVTDGVAVVTHAMSVIVADVNEVPVVGDDGGAGFTTTEDTLFTTADVTVNDNDVDDPIDPATITVTAGPTNGVLTDNGDGTFDFDPNAEWSGTDSFRYTVTDTGSLVSNEATVTIVVDPVNDAPNVTNPGTTAVAEQTAFSLQMTATDVEGNGITYSAIGLPAGLSISTTGLISGSPDPGTQGSHSVDVTATDDGAPPAPSTVTFTVDVGYHLASADVGTVVINEVLYNSVSGTAPEEFVELYNRSGSSVGLTGWALTDGNLKADGAEDLAYTLPATDHWGNPSTLAAGEYAVVWVVYDGANLPPLLNPASGLEYVVNVSGTKLGDSGDDLWLLDVGTRVVDFMAYGTGGQVGTAPEASLNLWDATDQAALFTAAAESIVVTPNGGDSNSSACWEPTASGDAAGRCGGALSTFDTDSMGALATSVGRGNNAASANAGGPYALDEGGALVLDGSSSIGASSWAWDLDNDGQYDDAVGVNPTVPWATLSPLGVDDDGTYTVGLEVDGGADTASATATISNVVPVLSTTGTGTINTGGTYTLNLAVTDPGADTISGWTINWGDGSIESVVGNPSSVTHTYTGSGLVYNVLASATDEDGTYLQNDLVTPSYASDEVFRYAATTGTFLQKFATATTPIEAMIGPDGAMYVSGQQSNNVMRYNAQTGAFIDEFVAAGAGGLNDADGLAFGPDGNLYVADWGAGEVLRYNGTTGAYIDVFANTGLSGPYGMLFGPDSNLYVGDFNANDVSRFDGVSGAFIDVLISGGSGGLDEPEQITFGPDGNIYAASSASDEVLRYNGTTGAFIDIFIASGGAGGLDEPTGLTFGPDGHLYVADFIDDVILRYNGTTGAFIDEYVSPGSGGLTEPVFLTFIPEHQVTVTP